MRGCVRLASLQRIEKILGNVVCAFLSVPALLLRHQALPDPRNVKKVLVVKFFGIGSLVLATPFFRTARKTFPKAEIHLLTLSSNNDIIKMIPDVDHVHFVHLGINVVTAVLAFVACLFRINRGGFDVLIDMEFYTRASSVVTFASWAPARVGYHSRGVYRGAIHNFRVPFNVYWHVTRNFIGLLAPFGVEVPATAAAPRLKIPAAAAAQSAEVLAPFGGKGVRYLIVNVNSGELAFERRWLPDRFADLTSRLCGKYDLFALFVGSRGERPYVERVVEKVVEAGGRAHNLAGDLTLECLIELCRGSVLTISNDSGPVHLAAAAEARVVAFFGPETPVLYGPIGDNHLVFYKHPACSPCITVEYGKQLDCWHQTPFCQVAITVDDVMRRIENHYGPILQTESAGFDKAAGK